MDAYRLGMGGGNLRSPALPFVAFEADRPDFFQGPGLQCVTINEMRYNISFYFKNTKNLIVIRAPKYLYHMHTT